MTTSDAAVPADGHAGDLVSARLDGELDATTAAWVDAHLAACEPCQHDRWSVDAARRGCGRPRSSTRAGGRRRHRSPPSTDRHRRGLRRRGRGRARTARRHCVGRRTAHVVPDVAALLDGARGPRPHASMDGMRLVDGSRVPLRGAAAMVGATGRPARAGGDLRRPRPDGRRVRRRDGGGDRCSSSRAASTGTASLRRESAHRCAAGRGTRDGTPVGRGRRRDRPPGGDRGRPTTSRRRSAVVETARPAASDIDGRSGARRLQRLMEVFALGRLTYDPGGPRRGRRGDPTIRRSMSSRPRLADSVGRRRVRGDRTARSRVDHGRRWPTSSRRGSRRRRTVPDDFSGFTTTRAPARCSPDRRPRGDW